jgi:opacity protein-like surface antigen
MKRLVIAVGVITAVLASGVAAATVLSSPSPKPTGESKQTRQAPVRESDEPNESAAAVHGGPIQRFHKAGGCGLVDVGTLQGNWTHGDYVAAVAALGDASIIPIAAHSDCGKPMVAVDHRHGPPDLVLQKIRSHKRGGEGSQTPGG